MERILIQGKDILIHKKLNVIACTPLFYFLSFIFHIRCLAWGKKAHQTLCRFSFFRWLLRIWNKECLLFNGFCLDQLNCDLVDFSILISCFPEWGNVIIKKKFLCCSFSSFIWTIAFPWQAQQFCFVWKI